MKILACMYGGEHGYNALKIACKIAKGMGADIHVLYVFEKIPDRYMAQFEATVAGPGTTIAELIRGTPEMRENISKKVDGILGESGCKADVEFVSKKKVADAILEEAGDRYELVVLGSAEFRGIERSIFGSVSYNVAEHADVPVLVVKRETDEIKNVLTCTDGSDEAQLACVMAAQIAKAVGANVTLMSVASEYFDSETATKCDLEGRNCVQEEVGIEVKSLCKAGEGIKSVREEIIKEASNHDLVVCGSRGLSAMERVRMGHVSLAVKENADANVLIVR